MDSPIIIDWMSPLSVSGVLGVIFIFSSHFSMEFLCANRIAPDGTPRSAASHLGYIVCLCPIKGTQGLNEFNRHHPIRLSITNRSIFRGSTGAFSFAPDFNKMFGAQGSSSSGSLRNL